MTRKEYIAKYSKDMVDACAGTGLFPSVMMAQGILESRDGNSSLAEKYNNHFGIKCECNACPCYLLGQRVNLPSKEYDSNNNAYWKNSYFRTYKNTFDGFSDRISFLKVNPRYKKNGVFSATSPQEQTAALRTAGYATDQNYAGLLNSLIRDYDLESLDSMKAERRLTSNQTNYAIVGGIIIALTGYVYYLKRKKII
jgi:flagellum-specific peptidoglycan hydrolase FlgJ